MDADDGGGEKKQMREAHGGLGLADPPAKYKTQRWKTTQAQGKDFTIGWNTGEWHSIGNGWASGWSPVVALPRRFHSGCGSGSRNRLRALCFYWPGSCLHSSQRFEECDWFESIALALNGSRVPAFSEMTRRDKQPDGWTFQPKSSQRCTCAGLL